MFSFSSFLRLTIASSGILTILALAFFVTTLGLAGFRVSSSPLAPFRPSFTFYIHISIYTLSWLRRL